MSNKIRKEIKKRIQTIAAINKLKEEELRKRDEAREEMKAAEKEIDADSYLAAKEREEESQLRIEFHERKLKEMYPLLPEGQAVELWAEESSPLLKEVVNASLKYKEEQAALYKSFEEYMEKVRAYYSKRIEIWTLCRPDWKSEGVTSGVNGVLGVAESIPNNLQMSADFDFFKRKGFLDHEKAAEHGALLMNQGII